MTTKTREQESTLVFATEGSELLGSFDVLIGGEVRVDSSGKVLLIEPVEADCNYDNCKRRNLEHHCFLRTYEQCSYYPNQ